MLEVGREFRANVESMVEILAKHGAGVRLPHAAEEALEGILGRQVSQSPEWAASGSAALAGVLEPERLHSHGRRLG